MELGTVAHIPIPAAWETEAAGSQVEGQPEELSETYQKQNHEKEIMKD